MLVCRESAVIQDPKSTLYNSVDAWSSYVKVPILVAAGPSNGFLVLVWYVMIIIIIILEYDNVIISD